MLGNCWLNLFSMKTMCGFHSECDESKAKQSWLNLAQADLEA
jgi:hypothetical protein